MAGHRTVLSLSDEAIAAIERNARSPNKKSEFVNDAIVWYDKMGQVRGAPGVGILESLLERIAGIESILSEKGK